MMQQNGQSPIWLFDGVCVLCSQAVQYTLRHERAQNIRFVAIQSAEGRDIAKAHGINADNPDTFLFIENDVAYGKSDGVIALAHHLNGPARLIIIGKFFPRFARNWLYDRIASNRYRLFGKRQSCLRPDAATLNRFALPDQTQ